MGMFDDLVPAQQTEQGAAGGLFDDLIPPSPPPAAVDTKKYPYSAENPPPPPKRVRHKEHPTYVSEYIDEAGRAVARGATNFVGQIYKGASAGSLSDTQEADSVAAEFQNIPKMDDAQFAQFYARALKLAHKNPDAQRAIGESVRMVRNGQAAPNQALGWRQMLDTRTPQETAEFKTGQAIQDYAQRQFPQAPEFKDSWTSTIAEAGGSTLPYLATALAGPLSLPLGMLAGIKSGEGEALDRALQHPGTTNKQVLDAATWGAIPGATEQLPIEYLLRRIPVPVANKFGKLVVELGKQAFAEGGQEAVNQLGQNLVENYVYNPDKDLTEGVLEAAGIGAIVGGTMQVAVDGGASITDKIIGKPKDPGTTAAPGKTDRQTRTANTDGFSVQSKGQRIEPRLFDDLIPETQQNPASDAKSDNLTETRQFVRLSEMDETDILRQTGYSLEQIADMNPAERAQAAQEARQQGIEPIGTIAPGAPPVGTSATAPGFGTRKQRASIQTDQDMAAVRPVVNAQPSEAQAAAGNYQKGHINLHGLDISIENPKGSVRRGTDPDTGEAWQSPSLPADYGYVKGTKGKDGDHVDVYIGPNPQSDRVYVIDQVNLKDGKFDEHKAVLAANSPQEAVDLYVNSFDVPTLDRIGDVTEMSVDEFKAWSKNGRATKRPAGQIPQQIQPDRLKVTEQAPVEPVDTAQSLATADKAFDSYMASRKPLTPEGFAAASGLDVKAAGRAIQRAALAGRVIQTRSGKWMRAPQRSTPINAVEFIASLGGIQDVTGELAGMDLPKMTPYGPVVRKTGLHPDKVREALVEAGYLQDAGRDTGGQAQTTVDDVYQLLDAHMRGQKAYSVQDQAWADDVAATKRNEQLDPEWRPIHPVAQIHGLETWEKVQAFFADSGTSEETWSPQEVSDAARLVAGGMDAGDAFERAAFLQIEERANPIDPEAEFPEVIEWMRARDQYAMELFGDPPPFPDVEQPRAAQPEAVEEESNGGAQPVQQAGSEPADQADVAGDGAEDAGTGEVRSEETGQDGTAVEPGADNLPQTVLPGAEAVSEADATKAAKAEKARKELEARRKQSKLRKSGQTSVEDQAGGLFGGKGPKQSSLLDATSQAELAEAKPNSGSDKPDSVSREANPTPSKIEDFGEKITGARKDAVRDIVKTLSDNLDVTTEPLSKTFPQPDYVKMAEAGVDREALAYVALFRAEIPTKPQKSWKVKQWSEQVKILRDFSHNLLTGELSAAAIRKKIYDDMPILAKVARTAEIIKDIEPKYLAYASQYSVASSQVSYLRGQQFKPAKQMFLLETDKQRWTDVDAEKLEDLREPALAFIRKKAEAELGSDGEGEPRRTPLLLYKDRFTKDIFIGFKGRIDVIRLKTGFKESKEARLYMADHADEMQAQIDAMRQEPDLRRAANAPRSGPPRRAGDATPELFQEAFGFRGVQFGNYVEGDRRQSDLNEAFDALMDLADTLGIPSQALSLGGKLGLAFGARGHGGKRAAAAHYEPSQIVINLTKHAGPGSLAHEWLHAFDHYFARLNSGSDGRAYISEAKKRGAAREPVWQAWEAIEKAISSGTFAKRSDELDKARSKSYYGTTIEKAARAFERYIVDRLAEKQTNNDYLANIDTSGGAYPTEQEMQEAGIRKAFDDLFAAIEVTKNERGQAVLSSRGARPAAAAPRAHAIPRTATITTVHPSTDTLKAHPDYTAAKAGDEAATARLIPDIVTGDYLKSAREEFPRDAIFVAVHAEEASGRNKLPQGFAAYLATNLGGSLDTGIVQSNQVFHTGAGPMERLLSRAQFAGSVAPGGKYVIVDDVTVLGGTIAEMADYIQSQGGTVVGVATLANQSRNGVRGLAAALPAQVKDIERRFGHEVRTEFGINPAALTYDEAFHLRGFRDADALRDRVAAARQERQRRLLSKGIQQDRLNSEGGDRPVVDSRLRPNKFRYAISDKQRRAVVADVQEAAQRILGHHLQKVMTANDLEPFGFSSDEDGVFDPNTGAIWIALQGAQDPRSTIRHEAIHALRQAGVFTKPEWAALSRMAASEWIDRYNIRDRYEQLYRERFDLTDAQIEELLTEEAVADAFADHMDSPRGEDVIARIFEKLRRFLEAVRSALKGQGFTTASQVFGDIDRGVMGRRDAGAGTSREFMLYGRQGSQGPLSSRGRQAPPRNPAQGSFQPLHEQPMEAWRDDTLRYWGAGQKIDQAIRAAGQERYVLLKDRHVAISRMVEAAERAIGRKLPDHMDPFLASRLFAGRMPEAVRQFEENEVQPLVAAMAERRITPEELGQWLSAHHAEERNMHLGQYFKPGDPFHDAITDPTQIGASGWSTDQAIEVKQRFAHRAKAFGHVAEMVYRMQDQALDLRLRAGLIDQATHDRLHRDGSNAVYQFYVPQQGFEAEPDNAEFIPGVGAGFDLRSPEFIRAMGRRSRADNPLAYIVSSAKKGIIRAEKARVDRSLMLFIQNFPNPDLYELNKVNMKRAFSTDAQGNVTIENARDRSADHDDNVLVVKIGGKSYRITFSSTPAGNKLARAFKNLEAAQLGTFTAFMHKAVRMWAQLNTSRDPQFLLKNFNIDTITALINVSSESPKDRKARVASSMVRSVGSAIRGMNRHLQGKHDTEWSRHAKEFAANGGKMEFLGLMGIEAEKKMFDRTYRQQTERLPMTKRMAYDFTIGRLERWNDALENAWRLSAYVALRNNGVSANRAAQAARDLTVDFAVHGEKGPMINAFYAFFNATAEGQINLVKRYVYNKYTRRIMNGLILMGFMQTLLNYWIAGDDDDGEDKYQKIPDFVKLNNFVFMVPEFVPEQYRPQSGYVTYPARGWNIFHVIGQMAAETVVGGRTPEEAAAIAGTAMLEFANPMGSSGSLLNIMAPTFIDPIVDIENNKNFMGQQIVPDYGVFDKRPDSEKYRETTSEAFRAPAQLLNEQTGGSDTRPGKISISPETLEHWYEFATGGLGRLLSRSWNTIENFSVDEPLDPEKLPFARLYLGQDKSFEERNIYYEIRDKVDVTKRELDARKDDGDTDEESRVARTYAREVSMIKAVTDAERDMAKLRKERKAIKGNQQMGAKAKREAIEAVDMEMDAIMLYVRKQWNTWTPPVEAVQ